MFYYDTPPSQTQENSLPPGLVFMLSVVASQGWFSVMVSLKRKSLNRSFIPHLQRPGQNYSTLQALHPASFNCSPSSLSHHGARQLSLLPSLNISFYSLSITLLDVAPHHTLWCPFPKYLFCRRIMRGRGQNIPLSYSAWKAAADQWDCANCMTTQKC